MLKKLFFKIPLYEFVIKSIFFAVLYFASARFGLLMATLNQSVSPVWPATGVAFAILILGGIHYWPSIAIGAFLINYLTNTTYISAIGITFGNTLQAIIGFWIFSYFEMRKEKIGYHSRSLGIIGASFIGALLTASLGTASLYLTHQISWDSIQSIWPTWFTGDGLGGITFLPVMLSFSKKYSTDYSRPRPSSFTFTGLIAFGFLIAWLLFVRQKGSPYLFFIFPYLFCSVALGGERGASLGTMIISLLGVYSTTLGHGVFNHGSTNANLINLQLFLLSVAICSLLMTDIKRNSSLKRPAIILLFSWLLAGFLFLGFYLKFENESDKQFQETINNVRPILEGRMNLYYSALKSGSGLFAASDFVTQKEWKAFLEQAEYHDQLQAIEGLGVVFRVSKNKLTDFIKFQQSHGSPHFQYHLYPESFSKKTSSVQDQSDAYVITYIEPLESNRYKQGFDISSEDNRKIAAELARDSGEPAISNQVSMFNSPEKEYTFYIYYPIYSKGPPALSKEQRQSRLIGWIFAPIKASLFFDSVFKLKNFENLSYSVSEFSDKRPFSFSSDYFSLSSEKEEKRDIQLANKHFYFRFKHSKNFYFNQDNFSSWLGAISSIICLIIGTIIVSLQFVKKEALALADKKTADLVESEKLLKLALEGVGDAVWDWDITKSKVYYAPTYMNMLGHIPHEFSNDLNEWKSRIHPDDFNQVMADLDLHFQDMGNYVNEHRLKCKNNQYKWVLARGLIISRDSEGRPERMVGTITDITKFKQAEFEIEKQRRQLHSIFEGSSDALMLFGARGFIDCNSRTLKLFGLASKDEFISLHPAQISPPIQPDGSDSLGLANEQIKKTYALGINQFEWIHQKKDGENFPAEVFLTAFVYENERIIQACVRDITERKEVENALISQREKLVAAAKMSSLGEMAGGIAHEINNPLAIIMGKIAQIKRRLKDQEERALQPARLFEDLDIVEQTAKRISAIIKGLSAFSRNAENDKMDEVRVSLLIQDTLELSKERFRFSSVDLRLKIASEDNIVVLGKTSQLLQVLINLLNNAFDAVEHLQEKWVEIEVSTKENICLISVTDSGPGISSAILAKMMTPFFTTKEIGKGTGLGLSISKGIIEEHKGKLYYDRSSIYTRFVVELPLA